MKRVGLEGQEAVEFILITVLVFFGALFVLLVFGNKMANFFDKDSSISKSANNTSPILSKSSPVQYSPNYVTHTTNDNNKELFNNAITQKELAIEESIYSTPEIIENSDNTISMQIGNLTINNIPEQLNEYIQTSGASGGTNQISTAIDSVIANLKEMQAEAPTNSDIASMISYTEKVSEASKLVADAEEWFETAAKRLDSTGGQSVPQDNLLCQNGNIKKSNSGCDQTTGNKDFLYTRLDNVLKPMINNELKKLKDENKNLQKFSSNLSNQDLINIAEIIDTLSNQIDEIGENVKKSVDCQKKKIHNAEDLKNNVASQSTDLKAKLIERFKDRLQKKKAGHTEETGVAVK
ncbi:MAG: hypothetical protein AB1782_11870 [Cyanobacteriota bacterium]